MGDKTCVLRKFRLQPCTYTEMPVAVRTDSDLAFLAQNDSSNVLKSGIRLAEHPVCMYVYMYMCVCVCMYVCIMSVVPSFIPYLVRCCYLNFCCVLCELRTAAKATIQEHARSPRLQRASKVGYWPGC